MKRSEDVMLLALKMEEGATTYSMQVTTKKGQEILP